MRNILKASALAAFAAVLPWSVEAAPPYTIPKLRQNQYFDSNAVDVEEWLKDADYPEVRFIEPTSAVTGHMQHLLNQDYWYPLTSATAGKCSALGFFFVKELRKTVNVPMGIINSAADGTTIEKWLPSTTERNGYATKIVNDLEPLPSFPVKGVIWYQGESDGMYNKGVQYRYELQKLVRQWRTIWEDAQMPFLVPQLPFCGQQEKWCDVRLSQNWAAAHETNVYVVDAGHRRS